MWMNDRFRRTRGDQWADKPDGFWHHSDPEESTKRVCSVSLSYCVRVCYPLSNSAKQLRGPRQPAGRGVPGCAWTVTMTVAFLFFVFIFGRLGTSSALLPSAGQITWIHSKHIQYCTVYCSASQAFVSIFMIMVARHKKTVFDTKKRKSKFPQCALVGFRFLGKHADFFDACAENQHWRCP